MPPSGALTAVAATAVAAVVQRKSRRDNDGDGVQALQVLRALQEMFSNALRHSGSDRIDFSLTGPSDGDRSIAVEVRDHGRGFDPAATRAGARGLTSLRSRAHRLGGELTIEPAGPGTRVRLVFAAAGADPEPSLTSPSRRATVAP